MSKIKHLFSHFCCVIALSYFHTAFLPLFLNSQCSFQHEKMILNHRNHLHNYKFVQRTVKIVKNLKKRTEVLEKRYVIAHFCFHFWIQRGQIIKIYLFSSRGKTNRLNICFLMLLSSIAVPNFVEFWSLCYLTFLRTQKLYSVERHTKIIINCEQIRT